MVARSHTPESQQQSDWFPSFRALWSLCWRLSILLAFFIGIFASVLLDHWWAALGCVVGFILAAVVIRRVSTVEHQESSGDSIVFL
jgi:TRAP-type C4-dicarboxylate transport system permease large subunit